MPEALIWGASGGIGSALVRTFKQNGWRVFAAARDINAIPDTADHVYQFSADQVADFKEINLLIAQESSGLDLVVYAAGVNASEFISKMDAQTWHNVMNANLNGAYLAASHGIHLLNENGYYMVIGAYIDHITLAKMAPYATAKNGLETLIPILRKENRKHNFTIVRPGAVDTNFWDNVPFKMPKDNKTADIVANAIYDHIQTGENTDLDL